MVLAKLKSEKSGVGKKILKIIGILDKNLF